MTQFMNDASRKFEVSQSEFITVTWKCTVN